MNMHTHTLEFEKLPISRYRNKQSTTQAETWNAWESDVGENSCVVIINMFN